MDNSEFKKWLITPLDVSGDYKIFDRMLDLYGSLFDRLENEGIIINNQFHINFIRFCHLFYRNSRLNL